MAGSVVAIITLLLCSFLLVSLEIEAGTCQEQLTDTPSPPQATDSSDPLAAWLASASTTSPNVMFIVVDDLRPSLGCYGETNMATPNLDFLASKSILFKHAFVQQALCSPSRTSFLTGRRPETTGTVDLQTYFRTEVGNFTTLPQHFKNHG